jgi:hypothetical protein
MTERRVTIDISQQLNNEINKYLDLIGSKITKGEFAEKAVYEYLTKQKRFTALERKEYRKNINRTIYKYCITCKTMLVKTYIQKRDSVTKKHRKLYVGYFCALCNEVYTNNNDNLGNFKVENHLSDKSVVRQFIQTTLEEHGRLNLSQLVKHFEKFVNQKDSNYKLYQRLKYNLSQMRLDNIITVEISNNKRYYEIKKKDKTSTSNKTTAKTNGSVVHKYNSRRNTESKMKVSDRSMCQCGGCNTCLKQIKEIS